MDFQFITLLLSFLSLPSTFSMVFEENDYQAGLIFQKVSNARVTYDSFVLVYHTNLESLFKLKDKISILRGHLSRFCHFQGNYCDVRELSISRRFSMLYKDEQDMRLYEVQSRAGISRMKRVPWLAIGAASGIYLGVINAITSMYYGREIEKLKGDYSVLKKIDHDGLLFLRKNIITDKIVYQHLYKAAEELSLDMTNRTNQIIAGMSQAQGTFLLIV